MEITKSKEDTKSAVLKFEKEYYTLCEVQLICRYHGYTKKKSVRSINSGLHKGWDIYNPKSQQRVTFLKKA